MRTKNKILDINNTFNKQVYRIRESKRFLYGIIFYGLYFSVFSIGILFLGALMHLLLSIPANLAVWYVVLTIASHALAVWLDAVVLR